MQVKDVMTRGAEVVRPDATLQEAANKMKSLDIGPLPVCDGDKIIGMLRVAVLSAARRPTAPAGIATLRIFAHRR